MKGFVDEKIKSLNYKKLYEADNAQYSFNNHIYIIKNKMNDPENVNEFWDQLRQTVQTR